MRCVAYVLQTGEWRGPHDLRHKLTSFKEGNFRF